MDNFLRATLVVLCSTYLQRRDQLAREAKQLLGIKDRPAINKMVANHNHRHDFDIEKSRSPLSVHIPRVERLMRRINGPYFRTPHHSSGWLATPPNEVQTIP